MENARSLYVGEICEGGTCLDRLRALMDLGLSAKAFDTTPYLRQGPRLLRSIAHRYNLGPAIRRLNEGLLAFADKNCDYTHVWIDKGKWIWPETLQRLKRDNGTTLVHFTADAALVSNQSRHFRECIPLYDVLFTTKPFELELYKKLGARNLHLTFQAYEQTRFFPASCSSEALHRFGSDITFIGHYEKHYADCINALASSGMNVRVWGQKWDWYRRLHPWRGKFVAGDGVWGEDYPIALRCAKIALGLLSKWIPETTTTRTFEIPACAVFMLAERTEEHLSNFVEGKEAEFFGSQEELIEKARFYLGHPEERQRIAQAGYERCVKSGYSNHERLKWMLARVMECKR